MHEPSAHPVEPLLSRGAHALRNHVATIRSIVRLVDDVEIAEALDEASRAVLVQLERAIVLARVGLGEVPTVVAMSAEQLHDLAVRRAAREGVVDGGGASGAGLASSVEVPGPWAERLLCDLLHHATGATSVRLDGAFVAFDVPLRERPLEPLDAALADLALACGGELALDDSLACLRLPQPAPAE